VRRWNPGIFACRAAGQAIGETVIVIASGSQ